MRPAVLLSLLLLPAMGHTHTRSESYSQWYLTDSGITAVVTIAVREVTRLPEYEGSEQSLSDVFAAHLRKTMTVSGSAGSCDIRSSTPLRSAAGFVQIETAFDCGRCACGN